MSALDKIVISVSNMSCASCVGRVERALLQVPGVTRADVNLASDTATVTFVEGAVSAHDILTASTQAGYVAKLNSQEASSEAQQRKELAAKAYVRRTGFAGLLAAPVILLGMGGHVIPGFDASNYGHDWSSIQLDHSIFLHLTGAVWSGFKFLSPWLSSTFAGRTRYEFFGGHGNICCLSLFRGGNLPAASDARRCCGCLL